jgi:Pentapeptide repeats (8 copies)
VPDDRRLYRHPRRPDVPGGVVPIDIRLFIWTWHWKDGDVMWATCGVALVMLVLGLGLMASGRGPSGSNRFSLGASLVSGGFVTAAIFGLQLASNLNAKEESFQLAIAMQSDLSGFSPQGHSLKNAYLNSKVLDGARLSNTNLQWAKLRHAALRGTLFHKADLRHADLLGADLFEAELPGADLRNADLRSAKL